MDEDQYDELADGLNKLNRGNVHTMVMLAKLQAQVFVLEAMVAAIQVNDGADREEVQQKKSELYRECEKMAQDALKSWLAKNEIIQLPPDDSWWDRPGS